MIQDSDSTMKQPEAFKNQSNQGLNGITQTSGYMQVLPKPCPTCGRCPTYGYVNHPQLSPQVTWTYYQTTT